MAATWIINRREDLLWLSGPALISFIILGAFYLLVNIAQFNLVLAVGTIYFAWAITLDGTHVFATYTRTYFDRSFRASSSSLLRYSLLLLAVGPVLVLGYYLFAGEEAARAFYIIFHRFGLAFAYYHLSRQHWGFVALYSKRSGEANTRERFFNGGLLTFGLLYPLAQAGVIHQEPLQLAETLPVADATWRLLMFSLFGLAAFVAAVAVCITRLLPARQHLQRLFTSVAIVCAVIATLIAAVRTYGLHPTIQHIAWGCLFGFVAFGLVSLGRIALAYHAGRPVNRVKWLYILIVLATHNTILLLPVPLIVAVICLTIFHNIQYHRIVRFYNQNKYTVPEAKQQYGYASKLTESWPAFALLALLFSVSVVVPRVLIDQLIELELLNYALGAAFWGIAFHHYYIDGLIWKVGKSTELKQNLRLQTATAAS